MNAVSHNQNLVNHHIVADIKLQQQTESGLARHAPTIKQMATRYNSLVNEAETMAKATKYPLNLLPRPLDILQLYNLKANPPSR